ncbi:MAG: PqqD family protein [Clostridia bacterium]|nr:PqqD family protein [Clostridia bacterium]
MRLKEGFVLRRVAESYVAVAAGEASHEFQGMVKLNETAKVIWEGLERGETEEKIVDRLVKESGAEREIVAYDVREMIDEMDEAGLLTD